MGSVDIPAGSPDRTERPGDRLAIPRPWAWAAAAALAAGAVSLELHGGPGLAIAIAIVLAAAGAGLLGYAVGIAAFRRAVRRASEGSLEPVSLPRLSRPFMGPLADDYDAFARNMGSLFGEMEQAQLSIIAERNRHEAVLQGLPGALLVVDGEFQVRRANREAESLFGMPSDALMGANVFDLVKADEAGREVLREAFLYEQPVSNKVLALTLGGAARQVSLSLTFFQQSPQAAQASAAIVLQDVTDWKRLEDIARNAEKLVAMGQLAAGVAHELNTPLGTILGYARLLTEGRANEEKRAEYAREIHGEAQRCATIIDNLLAYARRDACQTETCEINGLIREVVEAVSNCQGRRHCVAIEADLRDSITVRGGPGQLDIVLVNVMVNAVQACASAAVPRVRVSSCVEGSRAIVAITDNGPGVPPEIRGKLFEPFFTTKGDSAGTGLGLAISQSIVTRTGGSIECDPAWTGGARFVITLPLAS